VTATRGRPIRKVLVANRGEIAVRVIRACRELDIGTVAVFSEADRAALHVRLADEARPIGPSPSRQSYLCGERLIDAARACGADAVHPGYGFLAENAGFARACAGEGITFIGPRAETIELMGEKTSARREALAAGVPVVPGTLEPLADEAVLRREAESLGYPVMLKAAAGGGGKGMRLVAEPAALGAALERARSEARSAFGDDRVYLEKAISSPRHVEIQVLADDHGNVLHLYERECSIQRRHQKVIEESPAPCLTPELRQRMGALAVALARRVGYRNAGTMEFLVGADRQPCFLEMNTRLQVEHPVTELVTGVDIVKQQIRIAQGEPLALRQEDVVQRGHALECRVYAEDPDAGFLPCPGTIRALVCPGGPGVRDDSGIYEGWTVPVDYDPLLSKLVVWGEDRAAAIARMRRAVTEYRVVGIRTTLPFFERVMRDPAFVAGEFDTSFVEKMRLGQPDEPLRPVEAAVVAAAIGALRERRSLSAAAAGNEAADGSPWRLAGWREAQGRLGD
jgi:acetyl-CoA carboxylase biotin carboxylase subunit